MTRLYPDVTDEWEWLKRYAYDPAEPIATVDIEWVRENEARMDATGVGDPRVIASCRYLERSY